MTRIHQLPGIDKEAASALRRAGIKTVEDLWRKVGVPFETGLYRAAQETGVSRQHLMDILAEGARARQDTRASPLDFITGKLGLFLVVLVLLWRGSGALALDGIPEWVTSRQGQTARVVVVTDKAGLPAFHVIQPGEVGLKLQARAEGSLLAVSEVEHHYLLRPAKDGEAIQEEDLSLVSLEGVDLSEHSLLTLAAPAENLNANVDQGARVKLLLSPLEREEGELPDPLQVEALVLQVERKPEGGPVVLTVALHQDLEEEVGRRLAVSEVFVLQDYR